MSDSQSISRHPLTLGLLTICLAATAFSLDPGSAWASAPTCSSPTAIQARQGTNTRISFYNNCSGWPAPELEITSAPQHGAVTPDLMSSNQAIYVSDNSYTGADSFSYKLRNADGESATVTQSITVNDPSYNTAPTCSSSTTEVQRGAPQYVSIYCLDAEGDAYSLAISSQGSKGTATAKTMGSYSYMEYDANPSTLGADSFQATATDSLGGTSAPVTANVTIIDPLTPQCSPPPPDSLPQIRSGLRKTLWLQCLPSRAGGTTTYSITQQPANGSASLIYGSQSGTAQIVPNAGFSGSDSFKFKAHNSVGDSDEITVSYTVSPSVNSAPMCGLSTGSLGFSGSDRIPVRVSQTRKLNLYCSDEDGDPITYRVHTAPSLGSLDIRQPDGTYAPDNVSYRAGSAQGADLFKLVANDGQVDSLPVPANVDVKASSYNTAPVCQAQSPIPDIERGGTSQLGVSCADRENDPLTYSLVDQPNPSKGSAVLRHQSSGSFTYAWVEYAALSGATASDSYGVVANDGFVNSAKVTQRVNFIAPRPPQCMGEPPKLAVRADRSKQVGASCWGSQAGGTTTYEVTTAPTHGEVSFPMGNAMGAMVYKPAADYEGVDSFRYRATNSAGSSPTMTQEIEISAEQNTGPVCWNSQSKVRAGRTRELDVFCYDADADPLTYSKKQSELPTKGTLGDFTQPDSESSFSPALVSYSADSAASGSDFFGFQVSDGRLSTDGRIDVAVLASSFNTAPTCWSGDISLRVAANSSLELDKRQAPCSDNEGDPLTFTPSTSPQHGTISAEDADGVRTYTPTPGYQGEDVIRIRANDGAADSAGEISLVITITAPTQVEVEAQRTPRGEAVRVQNYTDEKTGEAFVAVPASQVIQFERACMPLKYRTEIDPGAGTISTPRLVLTPTGGTARSFVMTGGSTSSRSEWEAEIDCVATGDTTIEYDITEAGDTVSVVVPLGGLTLIDPQGVVYDRTTYDQAITAGSSESQARSQAAIQGASVELQRRKNGTWRRVVSGDPAISPNVNPEVTAAEGLYQWDVEAGTYRVVVTKSGYVTATSRSVNVPPPVLDLHMPLERAATSPGSPPGELPTPAPATGGSSPSVPDGQGAGSGSSPPPGPTVSPSPTSPPGCSAKSGLARVQCAAKQKLGTQLASCSKKKGSAKARCISAAKRSYATTIATAKCNALPKKKRSACLKKAKRATASQSR